MLGPAKQKNNVMKTRVPSSCFSSRKIGEGSKEFRKKALEFELFEAMNAEKNRWKIIKNTSEVETIEMIYYRFDILNPQQGSL